MFIYKIYFRLIILLFALLSIRADDTDDEDTCNKEKSDALKVKESIFCAYDKTIRPVINYENVVKVEVYLRLRYFDYDSHSGTLNVDAFFPMTWTDEHLKWDLDKFNQVLDIPVSSDDIWTPDISIYNKGDLSLGPRVFQTADCILLNNGLVMCLPIIQIDGICEPDYTHWPYDVQICKLKIGSWMHRGDEIDLEINYKYVAEKSGMTPNPEWELLDVKVKKDLGPITSVNRTFPSLIFTFEIRRHSSASTATVVIPAFVMMLVAILTLWTDPQSADRIYLTALNILCHFSFLQHVVWEVPLNGDTVPNIILFLRDSLLMVCLALLETITVRIMLETERVAPSWLTGPLVVVLKSRVGQIFFLAELNPEEAASIASENQGDDTTLVDVSNSRQQKEWAMFGTALDRLILIAYITTYVIIIIIYVPK